MDFLEKLFSEVCDINQYLLHGIFATVAVGIVIFIMQKKADSKINQVIQSEGTRRRSQKLRFCNKILDNLKQINFILETIKKIAQDLPSKSSDPHAEAFVSLNDFAMKNKLIPGILHSNRILLDHFNDLSLYDDLLTIESFGGPSAVMIQQKEKTGTIFETDLDSNLV